MLSVAALAISIRYFLASKPADAGPVNRANLIFGRIHPQILSRMLAAGAMVSICWILSLGLAAQKERLLAGLILAVAVPAAMFLTITLLAFLLAFLPLEQQEPDPSYVAGIPKARIATRIVIGAVILGAAAIGMLR